MSEFTTTHTNQLYWSYPPEIVDQIVDESGWRHAPVPGMPGETIPYVDVRPVAGVGQAETGRTIMYIPGFVEGITNKASFAAELVTRGHRVVLPGQNRVAVAKSALEGRSMTDLQADNYLSVMEHAGVMEGQPDAFAHSYGGLVLDAMVRRVRGRDDENPFHQSTVFLGASAGLVEDESYGRLLSGWTRMLASEMTKKGQDFPDLDGSTGQASLRTMLANVPRTLAEAGHLAKDKIDAELPKHVGQLAVVDYAEDYLYPAARTAGLVGKLVANGAVWLTPYSLDQLNAPDGVSHRGVSGATHDDEQRNPARVAGAMDAFYAAQRNR